MKTVYVTKLFIFRCRISIVWLVVCFFVIVKETVFNLTSHIHNNHMQLYKCVSIFCQSIFENYPKQKTPFSYKLLLEIVLIYRNFTHKCNINNNNRMIMRK